MGTYLNPDNEDFRKTVNSRIYIDKTGIIEILNNKIDTDENYIAVSYARRFGKSQATGMIEAYYSLGCDSKELFSKYEISKLADFDRHLNKYNVLHLDMASMTDNHRDDFLNNILRKIQKDTAETFGDRIDTSQSVLDIINDIYKATGTKFVIIIDEWDCVIRNMSDRHDAVHEYMQFLHSIFKSAESRKFLALGYITGILPIKKIEDESALNNFKEYTMTNSGELTKYFGFTEEEVKYLCEKYDMNFDSVKEWYNGYLINKIHMYNPNSVYNAMIDHEFSSYWKNTSSFKMINTLITLEHTGLKEDIMEMLSGGKIGVNVSTFKNDLSEIHSKDNALTALIHLGYLGYDAEWKTAYIPNYEVATAFQSALSL